VNILGVYNIKGGVGKTATAVNLAFEASRNGWRTLLWDLDPQGAASFYLRVAPEAKGGKNLFEGKEGALEEIRGTDYANLEILPADLSYRNIDLLMDTTKKPTKTLLKLLRPLSARYDLVVLDCPPSLSLVSENIFRAADALLVPTIPTTLSQRTLAQLLTFLSRHDKLQTRVWPFFSMVDRRKRLHRDLVAAGFDAGTEPLRGEVPYCSTVERMGLTHAPVADSDPGSPAAHAFAALWGEVRERLS
jgi:cellulose biosynthesis protein BcsQ